VFTELRIKIPDRLKIVYVESQRAHFPLLTARIFNFEGLKNLVVNCFWAKAQFQDIDY
jgi:hypothetical protein